MSDLHYLDEYMLVEENVVPAMAGTRWGQIVAAPQGGMPPANPPECGLFLSQSNATQKGLAMRSSHGRAIGVELAVGGDRVDVAAARENCAFFTLDAPDIQSAVHLEPMELEGVPPGAISTRLHSQTTANGQSVAWDVALVTGYTRGVLVTTQYTPGP
ncbi:MAG: hypothetical protein QOH57_4891, partial [Mycobacterium sp.]|nr:hypothetical protein [Mycobacterium sp.]